MRLWFLLGCSGSPTEGEPERDDSGETTTPRSLEGCTITRSIDDYPLDAVPDTVCVETWGGDERHVLRRDCSATGGRTWGEENAWDAFGCPSRSRYWNGEEWTEVTYTCDEHHQVVFSTREGTYVNTYDTLDRIVRHEEVHENPDDPTYNVWTWAWHPNGRLAEEEYAEYLGHDRTAYTYDSHDALVASRRSWVSGREPDNILEVTHDALERPLLGYSGHIGWEYRFDWTYTDDSISAVHIGETLIAEERLVWQEARSWTCP